MTLPLCPSPTHTVGLIQTNARVAVGDDRSAGSGARAQPESYVKTITTLLSQV
jgi:hypothetical protein